MEISVGDPAIGTPTADRFIGGTLEGRYEVRSQIARGGMATVYEAVDTRLDRTVAIKIMHPAFAEDPDFVARFRREARAAARLTHPHVVALFDQGETGASTGNLPYLVMEYVPGRTLRDVLNEHGPLTPEQALTVLEPVLEALAAAHDAGFVHRDVKPENVLISDDGRVKVTDFGLARAVESVTAATQGLLIGTVAYLSPEHVEQGQADARSDVYGAGICLYEMVTGQVPYGGDTALAVAYQHVNADVPAPSSLAPSTPPEVDALVATATRRDPAARYPDCRAFLADVHRVRALLPAPRPLTRRTPSHPTLVVPAGVEIEASSGQATPAEAGASSSSPPPAAPVPSAGPPARRRRRRGWIVAVIALLLAVAGAAFAGWYLAAGPGRTVTVPGVLGLDAAAAEQALTEAGLTLTIAGEEYSETVAADLILRADPEGGAIVAAGETVSVVISLGPERYEVPDVVGSTLDEATAALEDANLALGETSRAWDPVAPIGSIISADPPVGTPLKPDTPVNLVVSKGPKPVKLPELAGTPADEARATLEDAGLVVEVVEEFSNTYSTGNVITSDPEPGTRVDVGGTVTLIVSKGPPPVEVPYLIDMFREDAIATLESLGLVANVQEGPFTPLNRVIAQDPGAGTMVPAGSTVTITIL